MSRPGAALEASLEGFAPVDLDTATAQAALQTRVDRKYLLAPAVFAELVDRLRGSTHVLTIGGRRAFAYESVYFDTPERTSYLAAAHGRRSRFKVRTRSYLDSEACFLEVKTSGGRGETVKARAPHALADRAHLTPEALAFVTGQLGDRVPPSALASTMTTTYHRATLVDRGAAYRLTCDTDLVCASTGGRSASVPGHVLVETKSAGAAQLPDRLLWAAGHRPVTVSKFATGTAATHPHLPANRWHRVLQRCFTAGPSTS